MAFFHTLLLISLTGVAAASNCEFYQTTIGSFNVTILNDGVSKLPLELLYPNIHPTALKEAAMSHFRTEALLYYNVLHIDTGEHKVVVDPGFGAGVPGFGRLLENMQNALLDPNEVDTVIVSHGHQGHFGVIKADGSFQFPNAQYYMEKIEVEFWEEATLETESIKALNIPEDVRTSMVKDAKRNLAAIKDNLTMVYFGDEIIPGVTAKPAVGDTPGQMGLLIKSGDDSVLFPADTMLSEPFNIDHPDWNSALELYPEEAVSNRFAWLEELAKYETRAFLFHLPFPGIGRIVKTSGGYIYRPETYQF